MNQLPRIRRAAGYTRFRLARQAEVSEYRLAMAEGGLIELTAYEIARLRQI